jgi:glycosyltransferase involved in cell wall biosynthesis
LRFDDVRVVYPAVSAPLSSRADAQADGKAVTIAFAGILAPHKGVMELVEAVQSLQGEGLDVRLSLAGEGPLREALPHEPWLTRHGHLSPEALSAVYASADIFCLPARNTRKLGILIGAEQFSYAVAEAMLHGLPCVVTDVGALSEVIGEGAPAVPENDPQALREALRGFISSPEARRTVGAYNRERARRLFHPDTQANALREALFA